MHELLDAVRCFLQDRTDREGTSATPISGVSIICATAPGGLVHAISRPLACLVLQGSKRVTMGSQRFDFTAGESLLIRANVPTVSQITQATKAAPYLSIVVELESSVIADLISQQEIAATRSPPPIQVEPTDSEVATAMLRLFTLIKRPAATAVLGTAYLREVHYWLLAGRHGPAVRLLGFKNSAHEGVTRAVNLLRERFAQPLPIEQLSAAAGMSPSTFHQHFRASTALSPLQFQKQLRLIEAKRLILADGLNASSAGFEVGYESVHQFSREYRRMFGKSPMRDAQAERERWRLAGEELRSSPATI